MKDVELISVGVESVRQFPSNYPVVRYHTQDTSMKLTEDGDILMSMNPDLKITEIPIEEIRWYEDPEAAAKDPWSHQHKIKSRFFAIKPEVKDLLVEHEGHAKNNMKVIKILIKNVDEANFFKRLKYLFTGNKKHLTSAQDYL